MIAPSFSRIALFVSCVGAGRLRQTRRCQTRRFPSPAAVPAHRQRRPRPAGRAFCDRRQRQSQDLQSPRSLSIARPMASSACSLPRWSIWIGPRSNPAPAWPSPGPSLRTRRRGPSSCARACAGATASRSRPTTSSLPGTRSCTTAEFNQTTYDLFRIGGQNFAVTKVDDLTVQVVTPEVFAPFVEFFGSVPILPKHVLQTAVTAKVFPAAYGAHLQAEPDRRVRPVSPEGIPARANSPCWSATRNTGWPTGKAAACPGSTR